MKSKFVRVCTAVPEIKVGDCGANAKSICKFIKKAYDRGADFCVFPELCITGATCGDLFFNSTLIEESKRAVETILGFMVRNDYEDMIVVVGAPVYVRGRLYNCAIVLQGEELLAIVPKKFVGISEANNQSRWFESGEKIMESEYINYISDAVDFNPEIVFIGQDDYLRFAIEVGSDFFALQSTGTKMAAAGASIIFNPSCVAYNINENPADYIIASKRIKGAYVHVNAGYGESSTDFIFSGYSSISENGEMIADDANVGINSMIFADIDLELIDNVRKKADVLYDDEIEYAEIDFKIKEKDYIKDGKLVNRLARNINPNPFLPLDVDESYFAAQVFQAQVLSLIKRLSFLKCENVVIGVSGGLDSTIALMVCVEAFKQLDIPTQNIHAITMPGFGTSGTTYTNSVELIKQVNASFKEISIKEACEKHFEDIGHDVSVQDLTFENAQARERTQILFDYASRVGGIVIGTGDLSEAALGWCTYNGDQMSSYNVNAGITKTCIKVVLKWYLENQEDKELEKLLLKIIDTPISPELLPANESGEISQVTEDIVGPYELHEFFLYHFVVNGFGPEKILLLAAQCFEKKYSYSEILNRLIFFVGKFFSQQYKRSVGVDGPAVLGVSLSPREGFNFPSDISSDMWVKRLCNL